MIQTYPNKSSVKYQKRGVPTNLYLSLSGTNCTHPATLPSNPNHTLYHLYQLKKTRILFQSTIVISNIVLIFQHPCSIFSSFFFQHFPAISASHHGPSPPSIGPGRFHRASPEAAEAHRALRVGRGQRSVDLGRHAASRQQLQETVAGADHGGDGLTLGELHLLVLGFCGDIYVDLCICVCMHVCMVWYGMVW